MVVMVVGEGLQGVGRRLMVVLVVVVRVKGKRGQERTNGKVKGWWR